MYEWDEDKRRSNLKKHGVDFEVVDGFDWDEAIIFEDVRERYGEQRRVAFGPIGETLYALVFTERTGRTRLISLREATKKERRLYAQEIRSQRH